MGNRGSKLKPDWLPAGPSALRVSASAGPGWDDVPVCHSAGREEGDSPVGERAAHFEVLTVHKARGIKAALGADLALEGERGDCTVVCAWPEGAELEAAPSWAQVKAKPRTPKGALGWKDALESHRPFLSYHELGSLLDEGPSKLYDALAKVLGLDALVDAQNALQQACSARDKAVKDADQGRKTILARLDEVSDERAGRVKEALGKKDWFCEAVERLR